MEQYILSLTDVKGSLYPQEILIIPAGRVSSDKGDFRLTATAARKLIEQFESRGNHIPVDFGHSSVDEAHSAPAVAAAWIVALRYDQKKGLIGKVEWLEGTEDLIENRRIKYLSPTIIVDDMGIVIDLHSVALTNVPAIHNQKELLAANRGNGMTNKDIDFIAGLIGDEEVTKDDWQEKLEAKVLSLSANEETEKQLALSRAKIKELEALSLPVVDKDTIEERADFWSDALDSLVTKLSRPTIDGLKSLLIGDNTHRNIYALSTNGGRDKALVKAIYELLKNEPDKVEMKELSKSQCSVLDSKGRDGNSGINQEIHRKMRQFAGVSEGK